MMLNNGFYVYKENYVLYRDGEAVTYSITWCGDYASWELWRHHIAPVKVGKDSSVATLLTASGITAGTEWAVEFIPEKDIPFGGFPPASLRHPSATTNIVREDSPVLDWAYKQGFVE